MHDQTDSPDTFDARKDQNDPSVLRHCLSVYSQHAQSIPKINGQRFSLSVFLLYFGI